MILFKSRAHEVVEEKPTGTLNLVVTAHFWNDEESGSIGRVEAAYHHAGMACSETDACPGCQRAKTMDRTETLDAGCTREDLLRRTVELENSACYYLAETGKKARATPAAGRSRHRAAGAQEASSTSK